MSFEDTINFNSYLTYKKIKENLVFNYKGINIIRGAAFNILNICLEQKKNNFLNIIKHLKYLFLKIDIKKIYQAFLYKKIIITELCGRKDHWQMLKMLSTSLPESFIVPLHPHKKDINIKYKTLYKIIKFLYQESLLNNFRLVDKIILAFELTYYCRQIDILEKEFNHFCLPGRAYIPLNSSVGIEAIMTLFFNRHNISTYHIFHGIFGNYKIKIANDIINGENITAAKILAFSETTRKDLIRDFSIRPEIIFTAGNIKYPNKKICLKTTFNRCLVLNGFGIYDHDFIKLLKILDDFSYKTKISFEIKPHPNSFIDFKKNMKWNKYISFIPKHTTLKELFIKRNYDFAITFNTVTYYECMYYDLVTFRYAVNENLDFKGLDDKFDSAETLIKKIKHYQEINLYDLNIQVEDLLIQTFGMGINNYSKIIINDLNVKNEFQS